MASVEANQMLAVAAAACDDKKGEDIRILALDPAESGLSDYFLICTGTNDRQTVAITDEIEIRLKQQFGAYPNAVEGRRQGEWVLMDYVDFIVHVFLPEKRAFYGLERLRPSATTLSVADLNAEIKNAIRAERSSKKAPRAVEPDEDVEGEQASPGRKAESGRDATKAGLTETRAKAASRKAASTEASSAAAGSPRKSPGKKSATKKSVAAKAPSPRALAAGAAGKARTAGAASKSAVKKSAVKKSAAKKRSSKGD